MIFFKRSFLSLFLTQFSGALNDNLFKNALLVLITFHASQWSTVAPETLSAIAGGVFILPFLLFSSLAGQLADKYDKAFLAKLTKWFELAVVAVVFVGFYIHSLTILLFALFLFGVQSAFFGPIKYAILPQYLRSDELVSANAWVESGTFVAVLLGTMIGALLAGVSGASNWIVFSCALVALLGWGAAQALPSVAAPAPSLKLSFNPWLQTLESLKIARAQNVVYWSVLSISWFWLYGLLVLSQFPVVAQKKLGGDETSVALLLMFFTVGIGFGSWVCERWVNRQDNLKGSSASLNVNRKTDETFEIKNLDVALKRRVQLHRISTFGGFGLALAGGFFSLWLWLHSAESMQGQTLSISVLIKQPQAVFLIFILCSMGFFGGIYTVPLYTLMQSESQSQTRARVIAANNVLNAAFMLGGALVSSVLLWAGFGLSAVFLIAGVAQLFFSLWFGRKKMNQ